LALCGTANGQLLSQGPVVSTKMCKLLLASSLFMKL
jgi:hypothetical protein